MSESRQNKETVRFDIPIKPRLPIHGVAEVRNTFAPSSKQSRTTNNLQLTTPSRLRRDGMTLIEVVLAIAVAGFVLAGATSFLVSVSNIWHERQNRHFFEDHVDGVTEFLKANFTMAGYEIGAGSDNGDGDTDESEDEAPKATTPDVEITPPDQGGSSQDDDNSSSGGLSGTSETPIVWEKLPGSAGYDEPLLSFSLNTEPPLLVGLDEVPFTKVQLFLHFDRSEGLSLLWYSNLQEEIEDERDLRRTLISPIVKELRYIYWDETFEKWEETTEPEEGEGDEEFLLPRYLKLIFEYEEEEKERIIAIPVPTQSAFVF